MIQFLGLHLNSRFAAATALGRDLSIWAKKRTEMINAVVDPSTGIVEVPAGEWIRAGAYALQEVYLQLPVKARKPWGIGLSGPSGWIALDVAFEPLSPLRLVPSDTLLDDIQHWLKANPLLMRRINVLLSPKDYFRFILSGGLVADVTSASRLGMLQARGTQWSRSRAEKTGLQISWLPPVFDAHVPTGRLSAEGIRRTSLPSGTWLIAGAHEVEAAILAAGDLRKKELWELSGPGSEVHLAYGIDGLEGVTPPSEWRLVRSALAGQQLLESGPQQPVDLEKSRAELEATGFAVSGIQRRTGEAEVGAAALAAIGSGLIKSWDKYYKNRVVE